MRSPVVCIKMLLVAKAVSVDSSDETTPLRRAMRSAGGVEMKSHGQIVACLIGVTLLIAGMAKLDLHNRPASAATESLLPGKYLVPVASLELALAAWLFSGIQATVSRFLSLLLFTGFATAAIYAIFLKKTSCGCFGSLQVSPWIMLTYDALAVCALSASLLIDRSGRRSVQSPAGMIDSGPNRLSVVSTVETE